VKRKRYDKRVRPSEKEGKGRLRGVKRVKTPLNEVCLRRARTERLIHGGKRSMIKKRGAEAGLGRKSQTHVNEESNAMKEKRLLQEGREQRKKASPIRYTSFRKSLERGRGYTFF